MKKNSLLLTLLLSMVVTNVWGEEIAIDRSGWSICAYANPESAIEGANDGRITAAIDGVTNTFFHSNWSGSKLGAGCPQAFLVDMGKTYDITKVTLLPRQDASAGYPLSYRIYTYSSNPPFTDFSEFDADNKSTKLSTDELGEATKSGTLEYSTGKELQTIEFTSTCRYILFIADDTYQTDKKWFCLAEFNAYHNVTTCKVTYNLKANGKTIYSYDIDAEPGLAYPKPELPSTANCSSDYYSMQTPEGIVPSSATASADINITYSLPFTVSESYESANWYTLTINSNKYYIYYEKDATSMPLSRTTTEYSDNDLFCFVGDIVNGFKIYNKGAGNGFLLSSAKSTFDGNTGGQTYVTMVATATAETQAYLWDVTKGNNIGDKTGFYLGQHDNNSGKNRINNRNGQLAYWNGGADTGSTFLAEGYDISLLEDKLDALLSTEYKTGTDPGYYDKTKVTAAKGTATTARNDVSRTVISLSHAITAYNNAIAAAMIMPEAGKTYQIISAVPGFETQQGVKKAMRINDDKTQLTWGTVDNNNKKFYWEVEEVSGNNITFKSVSGGLYPQPQTSQSSVVSVGTTKNACTVANLGSQQFTITPVNGTYNLHTGGHSNGAGVSGNIVSWSAGLNTGSAWYIHEATAPETYTITYYIEKDSKRVWEKAYDVALGSGYPTDVTINPFVNVTTPSGTPTDDEEVKLEYTTNYDCYNDVASVDTWYALDVHANHASYTVYNNTEDATNVGIYSPTPDYQHGAVINNNFAWAFIGDPFTGIKLYNKTTGQYITTATDGATATWSDGSANATFQVLPTNGNIANSFALKIDGYTNYLNHQGTALKGWGANDEGSSFRAFPINDAAYNLEYAFGAQYGTVIIPAYSAIPSGVKAYTCSAVDGTTLTLTEETNMIKANVPYILEGTGSVTFSNSFSTGTYTEASTSGLLTGVFTANEAPADSYVLLNNTQGLGFYHVNAGNQPTVGANRCYLTVPASGAKAFFFDNATAIKALETLTSDNAKIYDINGRELKSLQKGINIVGGQKILVK